MLENYSETQKTLLFKPTGKHILLMFILVVLLSPPLLFFYYRLSINRPNYPEKVLSKGGDFKGEADVVIDPGTPINKIAKELYEGDLINSEALFKVYLFLNKDKSIQAGHYKVPYNLSLVELVALFQKGAFDERVTFLEGWRVEEYAEKIDEVFGEESPGISREFLNLAKPLEGYLFPDTYFLPKMSSADLIVSALKDTFNKRVGKDFSEGYKNTGLGKDDIVTLASIVEREVVGDKERRIVAGILLKRLKNEWPLEADATVQYAVVEERLKSGETITEYWPKHLGAEELDIDSPYNTRKFKGLPPSPICNPSLSSIKAVMDPIESNYWFYLTGKDGTTHFSKTLEEHNRNMALYL